MAELRSARDYSDRRLMSRRKRFRLFMKAARLGNPAGQLAVAMMYRTGDGVTEDHARFFEWCLRAAERGSINACYVLGTAYENGDGTERDLDEAIAVYGMAAAAGHEEARMRLASIYLADPDHSDIAKAIGMFEAAAADGCGFAHNMLYLMHSCGIGTEVDDLRAFNHLKKAAACGCTDAIYALGCMYGKGGPHTMQDHARAFEQYERGADAGHVGCIAALGTAYMLGQGTVRDYGEALCLLSEASDLGSGEALNNLALMYMGGMGAPVDLKAALTLLEEASDLGSAQATSNLGSMYAMGLGVKRDRDKARTMFEQAVSEGHEPARHNLEVLDEESGRSRLFIQNGQGASPFEMHGR